MSSPAFIQACLGTEVGLNFLQWSRKLLPGSRLIHKLCWHAGYGARDKTRIRHVRTREGFTLSVDLSDHTFRGLYFGEDYEPEVTAAVKQLAAPGQTWWDIGANVGWFTFLLAKQVGSEGEVFAFEPNPFAFGLLRESFEFMEPDNVRLLPVALGDEEGQSTLFVPGDVSAVSGGHGRPSLLRQSDIANLQEREVRVTTVDHCLDNGLPAPFGIKMDVEGFESAVLNGATRLFEIAPPKVMIMEVTHLADALIKPVELVDRVMGFGYRAIHAENLQEYQRTGAIDGSWSKDFVFLHESQFEELHQKLVRPCH